MKNTTNATRSKKFDNAIYYNGVHYFPNDIKESNKREDKPFEVQGCYYSHKWVQDTFYINNELKNILNNIN